MKFTIITPSYNQAAFIERTIRSVVTQKGINKEFELEYIIMDGGSTDKSVEIIKKYAKKYPFIQWVSKKDKGQSDALNQGFNKATGDILAWLNSDDEYANKALSEVANSFKKNRNLNWLTGYSKIVDENGKEILKSVKLYKNFLTYLPMKFLYTENYISQPSTFFKKNIYEKIGKLNKDLYYCMDYDLWLRLLKDSKPKIIRKNLSLFRRYEQSKSGSGYEKQFKEQYEIAKKYTNNKILLLIHKLQNFKTIIIYKLI
jgi:glycosyltransferase involved in cell wall biosynthesis